MGEREMRQGKWEFLIDAVFFVFRFLFAAVVVVVVWVVQSIVLDMVKPRFGVETILGIRVRIDQALERIEGVV